jgi:hypothetical protein
VRAVTVGRLAAVGPELVVQLPVVRAVPGRMVSVVRVATAEPAVMLIRHSVPRRVLRSVGGAASAVALAIAALLAMAAPAGLLRLSPETRPAVTAALAVRRSRVMPASAVPAVSLPQIAVQLPAEMAVLVRQG